MIHLNLGSATRGGLNVLILFSVSMTLYLGRQIFIPTVISLLLACMLWPGVQWLNQRGVPLPGVRTGRAFPWLLPAIWRLRVSWSAACAAAIGILVVLFVSATLVFMLTIPRFLQSLPSEPGRAYEVYGKFRGRLARISPVPLDSYYLPEKAEDSAAFKYIQNALDARNPQFVIGSLLGILSVGGSWLWQSILILFILFFFLLEGRMLTQRLLELLGPEPEVRVRGIAALEDIAAAIRAFLVWRTIINFGMAVILGLIYYAVGLGQAWTWALITAVLLYVPYIGPILAGIPPVLDAMVTCESPWVATGLFAFYVAFVTLEGYFIVPLVMGRSMDLNATTVMLSCLFWDLVWGPAGLFLAMPLMAAAKVVCYHVPDWRPWANLMDTREILSDVEADLARAERADRRG